MRFSQFILLPFLAISAVEASFAGMPSQSSRPVVQPSRHTDTPHRKPDNLNEVAESGPSAGGAGHRRSAEPEPDPRSGPSPKGPGHRRDINDIDQEDQSGPSSKGRGH